MAATETAMREEADGVAAVAEDCQNGSTTGPEADMTTFLSLPAEIRQLVYKELLTTDCAFRLGHQGPYAHIAHKRLHPAVLRVNKEICREALPVLYGENTFFPGTIGHKPTYSASFVDSVGQHNTHFIRRIVAHSVYPRVMTKSYVDGWLAAFGLDLSRLKILAVSFAENTAEESRPSNGNGLTLIVPFQALYVQLSPSTANPPGTTTSQQGTPTVTTPPANGGQLSLPTSLRRRDHYKEATAKTAGWLEPMKRKEVESFVRLNNGDLRAGNNWLVYLSPAAKRKISEI